MAGEFVAQAASKESLRWCNGAGLANTGRLPPHGGGRAPAGCRPMAAAGHRPGGIDPKLSFADGSIRVAKSESSNAHEYAMRGAV